ncbi:Protein LURP-one-related 3 [Triticum urartu]|uniref:Protein LURP-one-related n=2 Tax=Triticum TaxID=4564 RepID=A0A9R1NKG2_TRITD|nr:Protein LURP-one-related 3 [Triticum urartu]VAH26622.1 unnamed protein product [Triticum turgidum subsp. durum]
MARVHSSPSFSSSSSPAGEGRGKVFTLWLKSLVLNGRGCTVYDSDGHIVYRVDNYGSKCSDNVCLMDLRGNIVVNIHKKKLAFGKWEGYKWTGRKQEASAWFKCDTTSPSTCDDFVSLKICVYAVVCTAKNVQRRLRWV